MKSSKVAFYSGTFDPPHIGHSVFLDIAKKRLGIDKAYLLVEPKPRDKKNITNLEKREDMVRLAFPKDELLNMSDSTFSIDQTLPKLITIANGAEIFFLMGSDVFLMMNNEHWKDLKKLVYATHIVVGYRTPHQKVDIYNHEKNLKLYFPGIKITVINKTIASVKSTVVREHLEYAGKSIDLSKAVANYVHKNKLYLK